MFIGIIMMLGFSGFEPQLQDVVSQFHELKTKEDEFVFFNTYTTSSNPSIQANSYAIKMKQAEYLYNPNKKLRILCDAKKDKNQLISHHPLNVHLRYIRLKLQERTPSFLVYPEYVETDRAFLKNVLETKDDPDFLDTYIYKFTSL